MELKCAVQHYEWGKLGSDSIVARLVKSAESGAVVEEGRPYAELWVGTHRNGPARLIDRDQLLADYIKDNADAIGPLVLRHFGQQVPFLLKVLSVRIPLSIQAHPDKKLAEQLHAEFPEVYTDPNHKPELAVALTPFEALCGFRPYNQIRTFIQNIPELSSLLCNESVEQLLCGGDAGEGEGGLRAVFASLMTCDARRCAQQLAALLQRLDTADSATQSACNYALLRRVHAAFPGDVGCWAVYLLNHVTLMPGQALYIAPGLPHAYLTGDCMECMAVSDNVLRAGLTPKARAVPQLVAALQYRAAPPAHTLLEPQLEDPYTCVWRPPVKDFALAKIQIPAGECHNTVLRAAPSVLLVLEGEGTAQDTEPIQLRAGTALFLKASRQLTLTAATHTHITVYQATCNI